MNDTVCQYICHLPKTSRQITSTWSQHELRQEICPTAVVDITRCHITSYRGVFTLSVSYVSPTHRLRLPRHTWFR